MPIVDAHVHIYPSKIAQRAVESVRGFYSLGAVEGVEGTVESLLSHEDSLITHRIVYSVAIKPSNVASINDFIAEECATHPNLFGFMAMHQDFEDPEAEIERAMGLGLRGIKLHPDTQAVSADDPRLMTIYEIAQAKHLPVVIHSGDYRYDYSHPRRIAHVLHAFPELVVDAAHFGGWSIYDIGADFLRSERCFVDTSSSIAFVGKRHFRELINLYGVERVLFGSDFPMWNPEDEIRQVSELGLSQREFELLTWHNAETFLGTTIR